RGMIWMDPSGPGEEVWTRQGPGGEMTYQPGEPSYVPPQDPWADTYGGASAPTEPLPAPEPSRGPGQFAPGVASPVDWSRSTIAPDDPVTSTSSGGSR